jgi:hypothetical protein
VQYFTQNPALTLFSFRVAQDPAADAVSKRSTDCGIWYQKGTCAHCLRVFPGIHKLKTHEPKCLDQQEQELQLFDKEKRDREYADVLRWLSSFYEVGVNPTLLS